jgi:two-component system sensor histidine kinase and response regulator WspE
MASSSDLSNLSMLELFRIEVEQQANVLTEGLLTLEQEDYSEERLSAMMRAAHSIKGAARLVDRTAIVEVAHKLEDCLVSGQGQTASLSAAQIDVLLKAVDVIQTIARNGDSDQNWVREHEEQFAALLGALDTVMGEDEAGLAAASHLSIETENSHEFACAVEPGGYQGEVTDNRVLRIAASQLDRLMALAGESMVQSRWLRPYAERMRRLKRDQWELVNTLEELRESLQGLALDDKIPNKLVEVQSKAAKCRDVVEQSVVDLESFDVRVESLTSRLHSEVIASRMRPFRDGVQGMARIVRDVARSLGKQAQLIINGLDTRVDREVLERIEAPLSHLINNAVDHGLESPEERLQAGKPATGTIWLDAFHQGGMLTVEVRDDGRGIDFELLRSKVLAKGLVSAEMAPNLSEAELIEFLFLPGFSTRDTVTALSGRGVGMDVVRDAIHEMRGRINSSSVTGEGTRFRMRLPLALSVVPSLLVKVAAEPYAFPLARVDQILRIPMSDINLQDGKQVLPLNGEEVPLLAASEILELKSNRAPSKLVSVVVVRDMATSYGIIVDNFQSEGDLVVHPLPPQLSKIRDISGAALSADGDPVLIIDVDDLIRSASKIVGESRMVEMTDAEDQGGGQQRKRILVVDDSITVREIERKLLEAAGYEVEVAVDGMDGWNAVRNSYFDLIITDVDMPRLNGFQLTRMIKREPAFRDLPVMMVSYKDREQDQLRGYEAGADFYLTKANFHDEALRKAVTRLLGGEGDK